MKFKTLCSLRSLAFGTLICAALGLTAGAQAHPAFTVDISGHGPAIIFIPGMNSSRATWDGTVAHLKDHYTCYTLQLAGFAGQKPIAAPLLPAMKTELLAYVRGQHLNRPVIVGHSLGGVIAMDVVEADPTLFGPVVIVDSLPFYAGNIPGVHNEAEAAPMLAQMKAGMSHMTQAAFTASAKTGVSTNLMTLSAAHQQELEQWSATSDVHTFVQATIEMMSLDLRAGLSRIQQPVLVLGTWQGWAQSFNQRGLHLGRADFVGTFQKQYANLPHMHFAMADYARHFVMWDDPAWFYQQLDAFLANPQHNVQKRGF